MAVQFSRSLRSLAMDSFRPSLIGLSLAILTMLALVAWFFLARVTLYEISQSAQINQDGRVKASFTPEAMNRLRPGQAAVFRPHTSGDQRAVALPAVVYDLQRGKDDVEVLVQADAEQATQLTAGLSGQVEVEVEYVTPITLVMRASGKFLNRARLPVSPQQPAGNNQP